MERGYTSYRTRLEELVGGDPRASYTRLDDEIAALDQFRQFISSAPWPASL
jgi:hypothetical protein